MEPIPYEKCLKLEKDRERAYRKTERGVFQSSFVSTDQASDDPDNPYKMQCMLSDGGRGCEAMIDEIDGVTPLSLYNRKKIKAVRAVERHIPECKPTLLQVIRNGSKRKESIICLAHQKLKKRHGKEYHEKLRRNEHRRSKSRVSQSAKSGRFGPTQNGTILNSEKSC